MKELLEKLAAYKKAHNFELTRIILYTDGSGTLQSLPARGMKNWAIDQSNEYDYEFDDLGQLERYLDSLTPMN